MTPPLLLNFSSATPKAIELLILNGVRVFSISSALNGQKWIELENVIRKNPEVIFVIATPHISGNSISVDDLDESPNRLAKEGLANVILAGSLKTYSYHEQKHTAGKRLGTAENAFAIDNQPGAERAKQFYMLNPESSSSFGLKIGGSSVAAPHLAQLVILAIANLKKFGSAVTVERVVGRLHAVMDETQAISWGSTRKVSFFTLDTVLINLNEPLRTAEIWPAAIGELSPPRPYKSPVNLCER